MAAGSSPGSGRPTASANGASVINAVSAWPMWSPWMTPSVFGFRRPSTGGSCRGIRWGQQILIEGDEADGLYILLSGHLRASVRGGMVGELGEGEIFGEIGLLERGKRSATVTVVSADAEVLFMSTGNFEQLVEAVPAFSWDIRKTATARREAPRRRAKGAARSDPPVEPDPE